VSHSYLLTFLFWRLVLVAVDAFKYGDPRAQPGHFNGIANSEISRNKKSLDSSAAMISTVLVDTPAGRRRRGGTMTVWVFHASYWSGLDRSGRYRPGAVHPSQAGQRSLDPARSHINKVGTRHNHPGAGPTEEEKGRGGSFAARWITWGWKGAGSFRWAINVIFPVPSLGDGLHFNNNGKDFRGWMKSFLDFLNGPEDFLALGPTH